MDNHRGEKVGVGTLMAIGHLSAMIFNLCRNTLVCREASVGVPGGFK